MTTAADYEITTEFQPEQSTEHWHRDAHYISRINGKHYHGLYGETEEKARAAAKRAVDRIVVDKNVEPDLQLYFGRPEETKVIDSTGHTHLGARVVIYSRGYLRRAVVIKVGRKNVEVAYVTAAGGVITHKSVPADKVYTEVLS